MDTCECCRELAQRCRFNGLRLGADVFRGPLALMWRGIWRCSIADHSDKGAQCGRTERIHEKRYAF